ncbi:hypothetical protein MPDQ_004291 [Monascus purpureus]|uniref:Uncharacterized protein n=1 Tax=Monascus purpureus TaxID=5098 RepID=A0A507QHI0_MONPU|nr:hypothetical protein MPDQ_004291 [Monascus purpureus]BDD59612.1 hypothetical protein MAP00_004807 [Monascus purpureus]
MLLLVPLVVFTGIHPVTVTAAAVPPEIRPAATTTATIAHDAFRGSVFEKRRFEGANAVRLMIAEEHDGDSDFGGNGDPTSNDIDIDIDLILSNPKQSSRTTTHKRASKNLPDYKEQEQDSLPEDEEDEEDEEYYHDTPSLVSGQLLLLAFLIFIIIGIVRGLS